MLSTSSSSGIALQLRHTPKLRNYHHFPLPQLLKNKSTLALDGWLTEQIRSVFAQKTIWSFRYATEGRKNSNPLTLKTEMPKEHLAEKTSELFLRSVLALPSALSQFTSVGETMALYPGQAS